MIIHALVHHCDIVRFYKWSAGWLERAVIAFLLDLLEHAISDLRVIVWPYRLIHKHFIFFSHGEQCSPIFPSLHSFAKIWFDNALRLSRVLGPSLIASQFHVLVYRLCIVLLLLSMLIDDLLGGLNSHKGVSIHCVRLLKRTFDFHVNSIIMGK